MTDTTPGQGECALESMVHLAKKICLMWGSPELDIFISRLIMDSRDGARQGLPMAVGAELLFLAQTNKILRAIDLARSQNISLKDAYATVDAGDHRRLEADEMDNPLVSRDTIIRSRDETARAVSERRREAMATSATGPAAQFGQLVFKLATSKLLIFFIITALLLKWLWPYLVKLSQ